MAFKTIKARLLFVFTLILIFVVFILFLGQSLNTYQQFKRTLIIGA